ncbi:MAG: hypothetical protein ACREIW_06205 [Chthoniobacterales bacterium]
MKNILRLTTGAIALSILAAPATARQQKLRQAETAPAPATVPTQPAPPPPNDTARFLAGMPLRKDSPLAPLTSDPAWLEHSASFEKAFAKLNTRQLSHLHEWQAGNLPESMEPIPVAYYMFSGPDFLYVDQFFPKASVYILCGKESLGPPPDPLRVMDLRAAFYNLENAMNSSLRFSFFITKDMKVDLQQQQLNGTLPILYVYLARAGKEIDEVAFGSLDSGGNFNQSAPGRGGTPGVRIRYRDGGTGQNQTLFYFTTDISDGGIAAAPGFMRFCDHHGVGASLLKSSSYLMFESGFNRVRDFVLNHSKIIVQDDAGIPIDRFDRSKWNLRVFGNYVGPIEIFKQFYQPKLNELYNTSNPPLLLFNYGYRWNYQNSNLIVATHN